MTCIHKHQTMDDGYHAKDFLTIDGAKDFLLGYEIIQAIRFMIEPVFGSIIVFVGPHDIPLFFILIQSICHTFLTCVFGEKNVLIVHPDLCIGLYISYFLCVSTTIVIYFTYPSPPPAKPLFPA